jgi:superfamily II DNA or RNA helicase
MPAYKSGAWDGKIHFVSQTGRFYNGLLSKILAFLGDEYEVELDECYKKMFDNIDTLKEDFIKVTDSTLTSVDPYIYQYRGAIKALYHQRAICEHATGSGKSYTIAMVINYLMRKNNDYKFLILVPKLDLVEQLYENFVSFGIDETYLGKYTGLQKDTDKRITISTWQSVYKNAKLLREFHVFICDEAHGLKADVVRSVAEKVINCEWRLGFTGTMPEQKADRLLVEGVLGPVVDQALYDELEKMKTISPLKINLLSIQYPDWLVERIASQEYSMEKEFIENDRFRNGLICKLADKYAKEGKNCLILVKKINHGENIVKLLKEKGHDPDFVTGEMKLNERNEIRHDVEKDGSKIIVATVGVYSTGVSINRLHVLIFAAAGKSKIQTLQSVGRGLRKHPTKNTLLLFDIGENLEFSKKHTNTRIKYYKTNKFNYNIVEVINNETYKQ